MLTARTATHVELDLNHSRTRFDSRRVHHHTLSCQCSAVQDSNNKALCRGALGADHAPVQFDEAADVSVGTQPALFKAR